MTTAGTPADRSIWGSHAASPADAASMSGEPPSLHALFTEHYPRVWRLLRRFGVQPAQLDDAAQEVFWVAARRLTDIQPGRATAFLYGIARRVASNEVRRHQAGPRLAELEDITFLVDPLPSPEEQLDQRRARELLELALQRLPHDLRTVLVLFELEGLELREIAEIEGVPLGTATSRLRRAREEFGSIGKRIRAALQTRGVSSR